jgi:hypothetical protein
MSKKAISVTLEPENLLWLRARAAALGCRSISQMLDRLIIDARKQTPVESVVGTIRLDPSDPDLLDADAAVRALFQE